MPDLDNRLVQARDAVATMHPPGDLWARVVERADDSDVAVPDRRIEWTPRRRSGWLAAGAVAAGVVLVVALLQRDGTKPLDTVRAKKVPASSPERAWSGPVRPPSDVVRSMAVDEQFAWDRFGEVVHGWMWDDALDAAEGWADITRVNDHTTTQPRWEIVLAAAPPPPAEAEPGVVIAYGLVFDTTGDGAADYVVGIDNDTPVRGDFHVWVKDLATGKTNERIGAPYGFPVEFAYPSEPEPGPASSPPAMVFTFLSGSAPADLRPDTRFYAWTSATRDGVIFAHDFAPDIGWMISDAP